MGRFLVTGVAGFVGSHLAESLLRDGHQVDGIDCFTDVYPRADKERNLEAVAEAGEIEVVEEDIGSCDLPAIVDRVDGVFHLAAMPGVRSSWGDDFRDYLHHNVFSAQRLFGVAAEAGKRVVFISSSSIYGDAMRYPTPETEVPAPISPYGVTKLAGEHLARAFARGGLDAVVLRYFNVYGPRQRPDMAFMKISNCLIRGGRFEIYGDGTQTRDVTYVDDTVAATRLAMESAPAGAVYNVGGGHETSLAEVIALFEDAAGASLDTRTLDWARGDARRTASDSRKIRSELGWEPATDLAEGVRAQVEWARRAT